MAAGAVVVALGGVAGVWYVDTVQHRTDVLVLSHAIPAGTSISSADLAEAAVVVPPGVAFVAANRRDALVGKVARADLTAGALLAPGAIGDPVPPPAGQSLVVLALPASRVPASGLHPGQPLVLVSTTDAGPAADAGADERPAQGATADAVVVRVAGTDQNGTTPVDVAVSAIDGPLWARLAASGRVTVLVESRGQAQR